MWKRCGAIFAVQLILFKRPDTVRALASAPPTRNLLSKTHGAAIAMSDWLWLAHLCGRAGPRRLARAAAS
eukprot:9120040-Pyramimonas_sp.AAC.1